MNAICDEQIEKYAKTSAAVVRAKYNFLFVGP